MPALLAVALIVVVGLAAWYLDLGKLVKPRLAEPLPEQSEPQSSASEPLFPPHTEETAVVTAQTEASAPLSEQSAASASSEVAAPVAQSAPSAAASAAKESPGSGLHFSFAQDAWVEVRDATGKAVFSQLGKAGSSQDVLGQPPFSAGGGQCPARQARIQRPSRRSRHQYQGQRRTSDAQVKRHEC